MQLPVLKNVQEIAESESLFAGYASRCRLPEPGRECEPRLRHAPRTPRRHISSTCTLVTSRRICGSIGTCMHACIPVLQSEGDDHEGSNQKATTSSLISFVLVSFATVPSLARLRRKPGADRERRSHCPKPFDQTDSLFSSTASSSPPSDSPSLEEAGSSSGGGGSVKLPAPVRGVGFRAHGAGHQHP